MSVHSPLRWRPSRTTPITEVDSLQPDGPCSVLNGLTRPGAIFVRLRNAAAGMARIARSESGCGRCSVRYRRKADATSQRKWSEGLSTVWQDSISTDARTLELGDSPR